MHMLKAIVCLLLLICLTRRNNAQGRFEDVDRESDFVSRFSDSSQHWDIRHNIPGEPDVDYPIYSIVPRTSFSCDNRHEGYYADVETRCQAFRICASTDINGDGFAFLCPNGTLFSQRNFVCDWYRNVDCSESENYYFMNEELGKTIKSMEDMLEAVKHMIEFPMRTATKALSHTTPSLIHTTARPTFRPITTFRPSQPLFTSTKSSNNLDIRPTTSHTTVKKPTEISKVENANRRENNVNKIQNNSRTTTRLPVTKEETESTDFSKLMNSGKVYVSNLGELSTDLGSTFNPQSSLIIGENSSKEDSQFDIDIRSSFGDDDDQNSKLQNKPEINLRTNTENLRNSLPASINDLFSSQDTSAQPAPQLNHFIPQPTRAPYSLSLAERINADLSGIAKISIAGDSPANKIYAGENSFVSPSFSSPEKPHTSGSLHSLAGNINSVFQTNTAVKHQKPLREQKQLGQGFPTQSSKPTSGGEFRHGRQFQFQGSGFQKQDDFASRTSIQNHQFAQSKTYLPAAMHQRTIDYKNDDIIFETTTLQPITNSFGTIPNLLINVEDFDASEDTRPDHFGENYVHVKKRAERLLLQGVHVTLYENDGNDINDNSIAENIQTNFEIIPQTTTSTTTETPATFSNLRTTLKPLTSEATTLTIILRTMPPRTAPPTITTPTITTPTISTSTTATPTTTTDTSTRKTVTYSTQLPTTKEYDGTTSRFSINFRRQTAKPINYTKKPLVAHNNSTVLNTTQTNKYRRRPTNRFSSKYSAQSSTVATETTEENDLTPQANSYGVRPNFNRIRNETNKYTLLKRTKLNYENRFNLYKNKSRTAPTILNITTTTSTASPPTTENTNYDFILQDSHQSHPESSVTTTTRNQGTIQGLPVLDNLKGLFPFQQPSDPKSSSSYIELPGTKVTIAKSQEQGHFSVSNDPKYTNQQTPTQTSGSNVYQPLEQFLKNTFLGHQTQHSQPQQQTGYSQQKYQQQHLPQQQSQQAYQPQQHIYQQQVPLTSHQPQIPQKQSTNFFLPFPTIPTTKKPIQGVSFQAIPSISHAIPSNLNQLYSTTQRPYIVPTNQLYHSQNKGYYESGFGRPESGHDQFSPFPQLDRITSNQFAQRRVDLLEDEKDEGKLYMGVSSYQVPISSVGRLSGDVVAQRKKRSSF